MANKTVVRLTTTHIDKHGERITLDSLKTLLEQTNDKIIPMGDEHDPRIPPKGRVISAELVKLEDGEYALDGVAELFNEDYTNIENVGDREIPVRECSDDKLKLIADRNYRSEGDQKMLIEIAEILKTDSLPEEEIKKSFDPISILTIAGAFVLGNIFDGFFNKIGADAYDTLKSKLGEIFSKNTNGKTEKLFSFDTTISDGKNSVNVEVILTNPNVEDIQDFFDYGIKELDSVLPRHFNTKPGFKRIVFEYNNYKLQVKFCVLKDGIPVYPNK